MLAPVVFLTSTTTGDISGNLLYKKMWRNVYAAVKQGKKVQSQLVRSTLLPKSVVQMIGAGESAGNFREYEVKDGKLETVKYR